MQKEEAGIIGDKNIKIDETENESDSSGTVKTDESFLLEHEKRELKPLSASEAKKAFKTHFEDINERL